MGYLLTKSTGPMPEQLNWSRCDLNKSIMKNTKFSGWLMGLSILLLTIGCDTSLDSSKDSTGNPGEQILPREPLDECEDCPIGCCCCGIEQIFNFGTLQLCGLCEGDYMCGTYSPDPPCSSISGIGKDITFTFGHTREVFCVEPGASFRIYNSGTSAITFRFACDLDQTPPSFQTFTIQPNQELFFFNDGSCLTEEC
jgi:hypothetical protein